jgi:hypothetical protein
MTDQVETKQVTWEDFEVAEESVVIDWEDSSPPKQTYQERLAELGGLARERLLHGRWENLEPIKVTEEQNITEWEEGNEPVPSELARMRGVMITVNVSLSEWDEAVTKAARHFARMQEIYRYAGEGRFEIIGAIPLCTPARNPLTYRSEDCSDGS